jgi:DNA-binding MarR family transcriptional regulator
MLECIFAAGKAMVRPTRAKKSAEKSANRSAKKPVRSQALKSAPMKVSGHAPLDIGVLRTHLGYFLRRLQVEIFRDFIKSLSEFDVRPAQFSVLVLIGANPGRSQAEIGKALNIERARLAKMLNELERRRWVRRRSAANDGRSHSLHLTPFGVEKLAQIKALAANHERHLAARLGKDRRQQLLGLLQEFG